MCVNFSGRWSWKRCSVYLYCEKIDRDCKWDQEGRKRRNRWRKREEWMIRSMARVGSLWCGRLGFATLEYLCLAQLLLKYPYFYLELVVCSCCRSIRCRWGRPEKRDKFRNLSLGECNNRWTTINRLSFFFFTARLCSSKYLLAFRLASWKGRLGNRLGG